MYQVRLDLTLDSTCSARAAAASEWLTSHNSQAGAVRVFDIPHPSPASPEANQGWDKLALHKFDQEGLLK